MVRCCLSCRRRVIKQPRSRPSLIPTRPSIMPYASSVGRSRWNRAGFCVVGTVSRAKQTSMSLARVGQSYNTCQTPTRPWMGDKQHKGLLIFRAICLRKPSRWFQCMARGLKHVIDRVMSRHRVRTGGARSACARVASAVLPVMRRGTPPTRLVPGPGLWQWPTYG